MNEARLFHKPEAKFPVLKDGASGRGKNAPVILFLALATMLLPLFTTSAFSQSIGTARTRGVWVGRKYLAALTKETTGQFLNALQKAKVNTLFVEAIAGGETVYESQFLKQNKLFAAKEKDFFKFFIHEAHKRGMEVHAWVWTFCVGTAFDENAFVKQHKDWMVRDRKGNVVTEQGSYYLNPVHPDVHVFLKKVFVELAQKFELDGVQLDYLRYPSPVPYVFSFDALSEKLFLEKEKVSLKALTPLQSSALYERWKKWKEENITAFLRDAVKELKIKKPDLVVSAAVYPDYPNLVSQDWKKWLEEKLLDFFCPMVYFSSTFEFEKNLRKVLSFSGTSLVYPGILVDVLSAEGVRDQIQASVKMETSGFSLFSAQSLSEKHFSMLQSLYYSQNIPAHRDNVLPLPPAKLSFSFSDNKTIKLAWRKPPPAADGDEALFYNIYRHIKEKPKERVKIGARVSGAAFEDKTAEPNATYVYGVSSLDDAGNESAPSEPAEIKVEGADKIPPYPPLNFSITQSFEGRVSFTWDAPPAAEDGDIPSYFRLCRGVAGVAGVEACTPTRISSVYWTDFIDDFSSSYYYYLVSYDKENNMSQPSEKIYYSPGNETVVLPKVTQLSASEEFPGEITLKWQLPPVSEGDTGSVMYYRVYRGEKVKVEKEIEVVVMKQVKNSKKNGENKNGKNEDASAKSDKSVKKSETSYVPVVKKQKITETVKTGPVLIADKVQKTFFQDAVFNGARDFYYQVAAMSKGGKEGKRAETMIQFENTPASRTAFLVSEYTASLNPGETQVHVKTCKQLFKEKGIGFTPVSDFLVEQGALTAKNYKLLVMPANRNMSLKEKEALRVFVEKGGKVLAFYQSAFKDEKDDSENKFSYVLSEVFNFKWSGFRNIVEKPGQTKRCVVLRPSASSPLFSEELPFVKLKKNIAMLNEPTEWLKELAAFYNEDGMTASYDDSFNSAILHGNGVMYFGADMCLPENTEDEDVQTLVARAANMLVPGLSDVTPPSAPQNVAAELLMENMVQISWENPNPWDKVRYTIYRSPFAETMTEGTVVAKDIASAEFVDTKASGSDTLYYAIQAKDALKNKSKLSKAVEVNMATHVAVLREDENDKYLKLFDAQARSSALRNFLVAARLPFSLISMMDLERSILLDKPFKLLILPAASSLSPQSVEQVQAFLQKGGKVMVLYEPTLKGGTTLEEFPLKDMLGMSLYCYDAPPEKVIAYAKTESGQSVLKNGSSVMSVSQQPLCFAYPEEGTNVLASWLQKDKITPAYSGANAAVTENKGALYFGFDFYKESSNPDLRQLLKTILFSLLGN